jgi:ketosteroid isomerase-like protein
MAAVHCRCSSPVNPTTDRFAPTQRTGNRGNTTIKMCIALKSRATHVILQWRSCDRVPSPPSGRSEKPDVSFGFSSFFNKANAMQKRFIPGAMILALLPICLIAATSPAPVVDDEKDVKAATAEFYKALNTLFTGDAGPMKEVWSHSKDVTYMGPGGGFQVGWDKIASEWDSQAAQKLGGKVKSDKLHITTSPTLAVVCGYEKGENVVDGKSQTVELRASTVFRKEDGKW